MNFIIKSKSFGEEEKEQPMVDRLLYSSSSYHHHHHHQQQQHFLSPAPPVHHHHGGGWLLDSHSHLEGQPSSNQEEQELGSSMMVEREHMFDKVVTPSDVGKLNRLVIPKKHAERYFPLDSSNNDKGLLLNFEDRFGKVWRFRYAYWNRSQSYVMTKGWSRFVKEKKLDAGDIVSFQRGVGVTAKDRLFIDWKRRVNAFSPSQPYHFFQNHDFIHPWNNPLVLQSLPARRNPNLMLHQSNNLNRDRSRSIYFGSSGLGITPPQPVHSMQRNGYGYGLGFDPRVLAQASASSNIPVHEKSYGKRLRLFGVNMDCAVSEDEDDQDYNYHPTELPQTSDVGCRSINPISSSLVSLSTIPYLQLRPFESGTEFNQSMKSSYSSSSAHDFNIIAKSTLPSNMSLDLEI